jgi:anti-sigma regulatory factor (Ser/Thr protein kinase)
VAAVPDSLEAALPPVPRDATQLSFEGAADLRSIRLRTAEAAMAAGVNRARVDDVVLAVCEAVTNSVQHAGGRTTVAQWGDGRSFVCEVRDQACISDPLAGRVRPPMAQGGGRGLWLMHQLCDLVQLRKLPDGQAIRLHVRC